MKSEHDEMIQKLKNTAVELRAVAKAMHDLFVQQEAYHESIENLLEWKAALLIEEVISKIK